MKGFSFQKKITWKKQVSHTKDHLTHLCLIFDLCNSSRKKIVDWNSRSGRLAEKLTVSKSVHEQQLRRSCNQCFFLSRMWNSLILSAINYLAAYKLPPPVVHNKKMHLRRSRLNTFLKMLEVCLSCFQRVTFRRFGESNRRGYLKLCPHVRKRKPGFKITVLGGVGERKWCSVLDRFPFYACMKFSGKENSLVRTGRKRHWRRWGVTVQDWGGSWTEKDTIRRNAWHSQLLCF